MLSLLDELLNSNAAVFLFVLISLIIYIIQQHFSHEKERQEFVELYQQTEMMKEDFLEMLMNLQASNSDRDKFENMSNLLKQENDLIKEKHQIEIENLKELNKQEIAKGRQDALKKSRSVMRGQASEHLAPFVIENTNPKDYRFMGNPIDYICFEGLSGILDGTSDEITCIHLIDIKTGKSTLNKSQRRIRDAIKDSRIKFSVINLDKELENKNGKTVEKSETKSTKES